MHEKIREIVPVIYIDGYDINQLFVYQKFSGGLRELHCCEHLLPQSNHQMSVVTYFPVTIHLDRDN